jgi:hypothetical protein
MKKIKINSKTMRVSAATERALRVLKKESFAAPKSEFEEGRGRYKTTVLSGHDAEYGIEHRGRWWPCRNMRERQFFDTHPRHNWGVFGNPRRINAILRKIDVT